MYCKKTATLTITHSVNHLHHCFTFSNRGFDEKIDFVSKDSQKCIKNMPFGQHVGHRQPEGIIQQYELLCGRHRSVSRWFVGNNAKRTRSIVPENPV